MQTETLTPAERWNLNEKARVTLDGTEYVVYEDGEYAWVMEAEAFDRPTTETDYSKWCSGAASGIGDPELCQAIADASLVAVYTAGACTLVIPRART